MASSTMSLALTLLCSALLLSVLAASAATHSDPPLLVPPPHPSAHFESHAPVHAPTHAPSQAPAQHHHHHHHHSNHISTQPPAQPPALAPTHHHHNHYASPAPAPVHAPATSLPPRKFVAVQGVVFCKSCQYRGIQTLLGATPLSGAVVKLQCNNTRFSQVKLATTDKNGYFFIQAPKTVTSYGAHKCKAALVSSPVKTCDQATNLYGGFTGSNLWLDRRSVTNNLPFDLFSAGPFAFEPAKAVNCSH